MSNLISATELASLIDSPQRVIVDARHSLSDPHWGQQAYQNAHIPGAIYLDLKQDLSGPIGIHGGRHPFPDAEILAKRLGQSGIGDQTHVVAYDDAGGMIAVRLWALLRWLGHDAVQILDGGLQAWQAAGYPLSTEAVHLEPQHLSIHLRPEWLIDRDEILQRSHELKLIDARSTERYRGEHETIDSQAGHIPGAYNHPFAHNLQDGSFKSARELDRAFAGLGLHKHDEIVVYCGSGVTANHTLLALERADYINTRLYVGSWSDWISYADSPLATGAEPGKMKPF